MSLNYLTQGNVYKKLIQFAGPFLLAQLLQSLYGAADMLTVGNFATTADVSGVTIGSQVMMIFTQFIIGLTMGITVLLGQYMGSKNHKALAETMGITIITFTIIGIVLTAGLLLGRDTIVSLMNTPQESVANTQAYLFYCSMGAFFITGYNVVCGIMRGLGDSKSPLLFVAIACVVNVVLDIVLIRYFGMGAAGAAIATTLAQAVSFLFSVAFLIRRGLGFAFSMKDIRFHKEQFRQLFKVGIPLGIQDILVGVSFLLIVAIVNPFGVVASASVGVVEKLVEFLFLVPIAMNAAVSAMVAQNYGAGEYERTRKCLRAAVWMTGGYGFLIAAYCQFFGTTLTGMFSSDAEVMNLAATYLQSYSWDIFLAGIVYCLGGYFNGYGRTIFNMTQNLAATFLARVPLALLLRQTIGTSLFAMGLASPVSTIASLVICLIYLKKMNAAYDTRTLGEAAQAA
ncbi:MATE family efflux transporter [Anaerovorax odorimutans]|uniref:Probable multidrug resistance protein NorM n=1 Tax=Anaerovorax odorimutans TaxID=109327 RepID=A0ABT1RM34_9FIRM|nr:MATE family efflux transporter [Anaerovorax odorimutans]MCQ4636246.1 MATE family efflux transporter [Anaerovorax odorimutans]